MAGSPSTQDPQDVHSNRLPILIGQGLFPLVYNGLKRMSPPEESEKNKKEAITARLLECQPCLRRYRCSRTFITVLSSFRWLKCLPQPLKLIGEHFKWDGREEGVLSAILHPHPIYLRSPIC